MIVVEFDTPIRISTIDSNTNSKETILNLKCGDYDTANEVLKEALNRLSKEYRKTRLDDSRILIEREYKILSNSLINLTKKRYDDNLSFLTKHDDGLYIDYD